MVALAELATDNKAELREKLASHLVKPRNAVTNYFADIMAHRAKELVLRKGAMVPRFSPSSVEFACRAFDSLVYSPSTLSEEELLGGKLMALVYEYYALLRLATLTDELLVHYNWCVSYNFDTERIKKATDALGNYN